MVKVIRKVSTFIRMSVMGLFTRLHLNGHSWCSIRWYMILVTMLTVVRIRTAIIGARVVS